MKSDIKLWYKIEIIHCSMLLDPPPGEPLGLYPLPVPQKSPGDFSWPPGIWLAIRRVQEF